MGALALGLAALREDGRATDDGRSGSTEDHRATHSSGADESTLTKGLSG